jgi:hypothetical protein
MIAALDSRGSAARTIAAASMESAIRLRNTAASYSSPSVKFPECAGMRAARRRVGKLPASGWGHNSLRYHPGPGGLNHWNFDTLANARPGRPPGKHSPSQDEESNAMRMTGTSKKLRLSTETLRLLDNADLTLAGGIATTVCGSWCLTSCNTCDTRNTCTTRYC